MASQRTPAPDEVDARTLLEGRLKVDQRVVLVVDDEPDILSSIKTFLSGCISGVRVVAVSSAEEGLEALDAEPVSLVISDYKLGGMDGLSFLKRAAELQPGTPRILMTAFPDLDVAMGSVNEAGVEKFLTKPLDPMGMVATVYDLLQERHAETERRKAYERALDILRKGPRGAGP